MVLVRAKELCKVSNAAVGRGKGYSFAIVKRVNRSSVCLSLVHFKLSLLPLFPSHHSLHSTQSRHSP